MFIVRRSLLSNASSRACHSALNGVTSDGEAFVGATYDTLAVWSGARRVATVREGLVLAEAATSD